MQRAMHAKAHFCKHLSAVLLYCRFDPEFLQQRHTELQQFLDCALHSVAVADCQHLVDFFEVPK
jgi:PX domain